ncbi:MAG: hypothetical protein HUU38_14090 [Anaerolineales bacterium]|nr:hypothetical protein [Anaerolineales bacterium]
MTLILATHDQLVVAEWKGDWQIVRRALPGMNVTAVMAREGVIIAGTTEGLFRSGDGGEHWEAINHGLTHPHIRWLAFHPQISDFELAGTEPTGVFISRDGGDSWRACEEVAALRDQFKWWLPYSPEAGCVRGFAIHGQRAYAAVEVGGVLRSEDGGQTWGMAPGSDGEPAFREPRPGFIHADVHSVEVHPASADWLFAPTNAGFYRSLDGGVTFERINRYGYTRACWPDPADARHILIGPARGVDSDGTVLETRDGGETWLEATTGLTMPWPHHMVERFTPIGDEVFAVLSNGEVFSTRTETIAWKPVLPEVKGVKAVCQVTVS